MSEEQSAQSKAELEATAKIDREMVYQGKIISLRVDTISVAGNKPYKREIVLHPGAVVIVPIDSQGNILMVKQWRRAAGQVLLELPAGTREEGEEPIFTAGRELQEETGFKAEHITSLGGFYSAPGFCTEYLHLFLAEGLTESRLPADVDEEIEVVTVPILEAVQMVNRGEIEDAKSIAGISRYVLGKVVSGQWSVIK